MKKKLSILPAILLLSMIVVSSLQSTNLFSLNHTSAAASTAVYVDGNQLVNGSGQVVRLYGVDLGGQGLCTEKNPTIYSSTINAAFMSVLESWHVNAVRLTMNEDCWLGINGVDPSVSGTAYQSFVSNTVSTMNAAGIEVILSLSLALPGTQVAGTTTPPNGPLPDTDHSLNFWTQVATAFKGNPGVIYDAYGEPQQISWPCWLNGCSVTSPGGGTYQGVGMQQLVNTIRATGAAQPIMLGGTDWSNNLSNWLAYEPTDPDHQLIASFHNYNYDSYCSNETCWNNTIKPLNATVPVVTGEMGEDDCKSTYIDSYATWADKQNISYLAWDWQTPTSSTDCKPKLLADYSGTPTTYGAGYQEHLDSLYNEGLISNLQGESSSPPTVTIATPTNDAQVYGNSISINATATANDGSSISSAEMLVNNTLVQTITNAPYNFNLDTLNYPDGTYTIEIEATDDQGNVGSASVTVYITNGDLNGDGVVNIQDLAIMAANWGTGTTYAQGNINGLGPVNIQDLAILAANWGYQAP